MYRPISTLNISKPVVKKLCNLGYNYVPDLIKDINKINLSTDIKNDIIQHKYVTKSCLDIEQEHIEVQHITTLSKQIDDLLEGGVPLKTITELCGSPGSGKTQLALQISANVQVPVEFNGLEGEVVFISTNSAFIIERFYEIAIECVEHFANIAKGSSDDKAKKAIQSFTVYSVLSRLHCIETADYIELVAAVESLKTFLQDKKVKLIVIDSMSFPFRYGVPILQRTRIINTIISNLRELASQHNLAVVLTNEITTRFNFYNDGLVPALGETYAQMINLRLMLGTGINNERIALVDKNSHINKHCAPFEISMKGIRDKE